MGATNPVIMLYRSLLRWTRRPAVKDAVFELPLLDDSLRSRWPTAPVRSATGVAQAIRRAFREDDLDPSNPEVGIEQAFALLRALQGYTKYIEELAEQREDHSDRSGIMYSIGDVLRHKQFAFRGVVVGWDRRPTVDVTHWDGMAGVSSEQAFYHVLPDTADCLTFLGGPRDWRYVAESNLSPTEISALERRVSSPHLPRFFTGFDSAVGRFVLQDDLQYIYPNDVETIPALPALPAADDVRAAVHAAESRVAAAVEGVGVLVSQTLETIPSLGEEAAKLADALAQLRQRSVPASGEESGIVTCGGSNSTECDVGSVVYPSLWQLRDVVAQVQSSASKREQAMMTYDLEFAVGDVVTHRKYNYRGIVIGYDQRPIMDVSGWDGVVDLPRSSDQPFYHVLPDENDCIEEFGAPRSWRYCAEENLDKIALSNLETGDEDDLVAPEVAAVLAAAGLSLPEEAWSRFEDISHEQLERLFERFDRDRGRYIPTEQLRYQYPQKEGFYHESDSLEALSDERAATARELLLKSVHLELSRVVLAGTSDGAPAAGGDSTRENPGILGDLYTLLRASTTPAVGEMLQETISFVRRAGIAAETVEKLKDLRESLVALTVLAADVAADGHWVTAAATTKQVSRDLQQIVSDVDALLADEPRAAVECHSLLASCFFAVARQGRAGRVRRRRPGVDVIRSSPGDEDAQRMVQDGVCWKIGDVIKHRKHGYTGVIVGWDNVCAAEEDWIVAMKVDALEHGRTQPFYTVLVDGDHWGVHVGQEQNDGGPAGEVCYVAQQNIQWADPATSRIRNRHIRDFFSENKPASDGQLVSSRQPLPWVLSQYPDDGLDASAEPHAAAGDEPFAEWGGFEGLRHRGLTEANSCLDIDPQDSTALCMRGALHLLADPPQVEDAIQSLEASLRSNPWGLGLSPAAPLLHRARRFGTGSPNVE